MTIFCRGRPESVPCASTCFTTSIPSRTSPKTTCLPSSHDVTAVVMKNYNAVSADAHKTRTQKRTCEPFVLGPALAIESRPGRVCLIEKFSSSKPTSQLKTLAS